MSNFQHTAKKKNRGSIDLGKGAAKHGGIVKQ